MILERAEELLKTQKLCNHCLGRAFAKLGKGTNEERGRAIRFVLSMEGKEFDEPEVCGLCGGVFERLDELAEKCTEKARDYEFESFMVGSSFPEEVLEKEGALFEGLPSEPINREFNRELGKRLERALGKRAERKNPDLTFLVEPYSGRVKIRTRSVYIYGRYRKLVRGIPQTPLKGYKESVASMITRPFAKAFGGKAVFHGAGREDVDVRMLGSGRPFFVEVKNPRRRRVELEEIAREINASGKAEVFGLRYSSGEEMKGVLSERHDKEYEALVYVPQGTDEGDLRKVLEVLNGAVIHQRTPRRVLKRRSDLTRVRKVYKVSGEVVDGTHLRLRIFCEGGLYIKELISGDGGRTSPSVSEILAKEAVCEALDVINVER
ncbi:tRNA pseudouridine(54/55) synthase Pus10 [Palaeococcus ferrophilus]|uniref:tRNA pseudouridine(54/55) synthase Pus10 n=1 Tax=Palaeococcus ferrophilus TaxID=83868 RepID=UPI00064FF47D|nr:tRNA pseudouridine(54/55) synthase Pus10 [Palaeococcus ferrophilus]